jgi:hypothetical protein
MTYYLAIPPLCMEVANTSLLTGNRRDRPGAHDGRSETRSLRLENRSREVGGARFVGSS